jgi:hypothetical protein
VLTSAHRCPQMKCIGADSPPCVRCSKVGRQCILPTSTQSHLTAPGASDKGVVPDQPELQSFSVAPVLCGSPADVVVSPVVAENVPHRIGSNYTSHKASSPHSTIIRGPWQSTLPNVFNRPVPSWYNSATPGLGHWHGWSSVAQVPGISHPSREPVLDAASSLPNDEEICHLSRFFETNLIEHVPVLTRVDVSDLGTIVKTKRLLVYCMAYVAARFVPGCRAFRNTLTPIIRSMFWLQFDQHESSDEQRWTLLQALAVLYTWVSIPYVEGQEDSELVLTMTQLKTSIETLALQYSLHNSAEEVTRLPKHDTSNLHQTFAFRKYTYWLWLFSTGYFQSLISQTPPRIREDTSITMASQLLQNPIYDDQLREILAPVELCLIWVDAGRRGHGLGQWWCGIPTQVELDSRLAVLHDLDRSLQVWQQRWTRRGPSSRLEDMPRIGRNSSIDICYYYTRFCISTYVTRLYQSSSSADTHMMSIINLVTQSIERAWSLCNFLLKLTPLAKSSMAFNPELNFAMIASCCDYLVYIYNYSADLDLLQSSQITAMAEVVELMIDLGADDRHSAKVYGRSIMARLQSARSGELWQPLPNMSSEKDGQTWSIGTNSYSVLSSQQ